MLTVKTEEIMTEAKLVGDLTQQVLQAVNQLGSQGLSTLDQEKEKVIKLIDRYGSAMFQLGQKKAILDQQTSAALEVAGTLHAMKNRTGEKKPE